MRAIDEQKESVTIVYTGHGKGKTSAGLGLVCRALGHDDRVAFVQFIKCWEVSEDRFLVAIASLYKDQLVTYKGGLGFFNAGALSASHVSEKQHKESARRTYEKALLYATSGDYDVVICDEINNAVADGLLPESDLVRLLQQKHSATSLCLTGRNFPPSLYNAVDIVSRIDKVRHHFDDGVMAKAGIDF